MFKVKVLLLSLLMMVALAKADIMDDCMDKHKITIEELTVFTKNAKDPNYHVEKKFKCYTQCFLDHFLEKDESGKYIMKPFWEEERHRNPSEQEIAKAKECNDKVDKVEDCEYAYYFMNCIKREN